jgi:hypothetical protein
MAKRLQNFEIYAGDARKIAFDVKDSADAPVDLTGMTFTWVVTKHRSLLPVVTKTTANGGVEVVGSAADGNAQINISGADSALLTDILYYHQCVMKDAANNETTVLTGYITALRRKVTP